MFTVVDILSLFPQPPGGTGQLSVPPTTLSHTSQMSKGASFENELQLDCVSVVSQDEDDDAIRKRVLQNEDILPLILIHLKDDLQDEALASEEASGLDDNPRSEEGELDATTTSSQSWRNGFASLILVDTSFFRAGTAILWKSMDSLSAIFGLLPWFRREYRGVGTFDPASPSSWERFNLYATLVQNLILQTAPDITIPTPWLLQLITLHGRPDPLFPNLQSISVSPEAYSGLHFLFLLLGESLITLNIAPCCAWDDYDYFPDSWEQNRKAKVAQETQVSLLAVLPMVSCSAPHLRSFEYTGPTSGEFFHHVSNLKNLVFLKLEIVNPQDRHSLTHLGELPLLRELTITAPFLYDGPTTSGSRALTQKQSASTSGPGPESPRLQKLEYLYIYTPEYIQYPVFRSLLPKDLNDLSMHFLSAKDPMPFHYALASYLRRNSDLEHLHVSFVQGEPGSGNEEVPEEILSDSDDNQGKRTQYWSSSASDAEALAKRALENSTSLVTIEIVAVPNFLWRSLSSMIQQNMSRWKSLTKLCLRCSKSLIVGTTEEGVKTGEEAMEECFPGLSFLAYTVWDQCPALEVLEFPFDEARVRQEGISDFLETCKIPANKTTRELGPSNSSEHPLHKLTIHTIGEADVARRKKPSIGLERKVGIARVLDHLFPNLKDIQGVGIWSDVEILVKSYQSVRREERSRMEII